MSLTATPGLSHLCVVSSLHRYARRGIQRRASPHGAGITRDTIWKAVGGARNLLGTQRLTEKHRKAGRCGRDNSRDQTARVAVIGLPDSVRACLFDLDGVLTRTATVHAVAWKEMFDGYLRERGRSSSRSIRSPTTPDTWTASRVTTGCGRSSPNGASSCLRASPATRRAPRPSAGWATARTSSSCG